MIMEPEIQDKKTIAVTACSTCNKDNTAVTDPDFGEIVCSNCGTVISEKLEDTSHQERRASTLEEEPPPVVIIIIVTALVQCIF